MGGPQAGIIAGKAKWIKQLKKNQLARVLRVDKVTLAALESTLRLYLNPEQAINQIPVLRDLLIDASLIKERVERFVSLLKSNHLMLGYLLEIINDFSEVGGGTLPTVQLGTWVLSISHPNRTAQEIEGICVMKRHPLFREYQKKR